MKTGIYKIQNTISNDPRDCYIGSAVDIDKRWKQHIRDADASKHHSIIFQRAWNKYNKKAFKFEIIEEIIFPSDYNNKFKKEHLLGREQYYLDIIKPRYNICKMAGNCSGRKHSDETRKKLSILNTGENHPRYGQSPSEETRRKIGEAQVGSNHHMYGKLHSEDTKQKMKDAHSGNKNHFYGKRHNEMTISRIRMASAKLSQDDVECIRMLLADKIPQHMIAKQFGVARTTISAISTRRNWRIS